MGSLFSKPKVDTSAQKAQEKRLAEQEAEQAASDEERKRKEQSTLRARRGRTGNQSLLSGLETGVSQSRESLG